jgi:hypothetical protein
VHRAEDPAALRKEFAERDEREEREEREERRRREREAKVAAQAKAASRAKQSGDGCAPKDGARLCRSCAFGRCGAVASFLAASLTDIYLCNVCSCQEILRRNGAASGKDECCVCGKWATSKTCSARLCTSCGFGQGKDKCVKCDRWAETAVLMMRRARHLPATAPQ